MTPIEKALQAIRIRVVREVMGYGDPVIVRPAARDAAVFFFAVGDIGAHDGFVTSRVAADIWTNSNEGGWTYQDVTGAHGMILHEGTEDECRAKLDAWLQCSDDRCCTHGHVA